MADFGNIRLNSIHFVSAVKKLSHKRAIIVPKKP